MADTRKTLGVRFVAEGIEDVRKQLEALGVEGKSAADKINNAFNNLKIADTLTNRLNLLKSTFAGLGQQLTTMKAGFANVAAGSERMAQGVQTAVTRITLFTAAVTGAVAAVALFVKGTADTAEEIQNQADAFGLSFENMQKLRDSMKAVGGDETLLQRGLTKFTAALNGTSEGAQKAEETLTKLRGEWKKAADGASSTAERFKIDEKYRTKVAEATKKLADEQGKFNGVTQDGLPGLIEYANKLAGMKTKQEQLAQVVEDFGSRGAPQFLAFLKSIATSFDEAAAAADKMLPALDELGQTNLKALDEAGDKLTTNFDRFTLLLGSRLAPALTSVFDIAREVLGTFGPSIAQAFGAAATALANKIIENKDAILQFANEATATIVRFAGDITDALNGINSDASSNWIVSLKDNAVAVFEFIRGTIVNVVIPAFKALSAALEPVAQALNAVFGTEFSGSSLAAVAVIAQLTGGFKILRGAIQASFGAAQILFDLLLSRKVIVATLVSAFTQLLSLARFAAIAIAGLVAANPEIAVILIAIGALATLLIKLSEQQTDAANAADAHRDAMQRLHEIQQEVDAGMPGSIQKLEDFKNAQLAAADAALTAAKVELAARKQQVADIEANAEGITKNSRAWFEVSRQIDQANSRVRVQEALIHTIEKNLAEQMIGYDNVKKHAEGATDQQQRLTNEVRKATQAVGGLEQGMKNITVRGPNGFEKTFKVPSAQLIKAQQEARKLTDELAKPVTTGAAVNTEPLLAPLEEAKKRIGDTLSFIGGAIAGAASMIAVPFVQAGAEIEQVWIDLSAAISAQTVALVEALPAFFDGLGAAISEKLAVIGQSFIDLSATISEQVAALVEAIPVFFEGLGAAVVERLASIPQAFLDLSVAVSEQVAALAESLPAFFDGVGVAIAERLAVIPQAFVDLSAAVSEQVSALAEALPAFFDGLGSAISAKIGDAFKNLASVTQTAIQSIAQTATSVWAAMVDNMAVNIRSLVDTVNSVASTIRSILSAIRSEIAATKAAASSARSTSSSVQSHATGGYISGPGSGTSDSILARLSNGEFVIKASAVKKWGIGFLSQLNGLRLPSTLKGYATGGLVTAGIAPTFSPRLMPDGGGSTHRVEFSIGGQVIGGFRATESALQQLGKAAQRSRLASGGRTPAWKA